MQGCQSVGHTLGPEAEELEDVVCNCSRLLEFLILSEDPKGPSYIRGIRAITSSGESNNGYPLLQLP